MSADGAAVTASHSGGPRAGAKRGDRAQWDDYIGALALRLDAEDEAFIDGLAPPGHASTHGYTDPMYPVTGGLPRTC